MKLCKNLIITGLAIASLPLATMAHTTKLQHASFNQATKHHTYSVAMTHTSAPTVGVIPPGGYPKAS